MEHSITYFTNACCEYKFGNYRLLTDPWLSETAFYGGWHHVKPVNIYPRPPDAIYISHIHPDHYDPETLRNFNRDVPWIILKDKYQFLKKAITRDFGADKTLIEIEDGETVEHGPLKLTMFAPFTTHPFFDAKIGNILDSCLVIECEDTVIINTNDNTPTLEAARMLKDRWPTITLAQLNFNAAGPYPACFENLTSKQKITAGDDVLMRNLRHMGDIDKILQPEWSMPFAGEFRSLVHSDETLGITTNDMAAEYLRYPLLLEMGETHYFEDYEPKQPTWFEDEPKPTEKELKAARERFIKMCKRFDYSPNWTIQINGFDVHYGDNLLECTMNAGLLGAIVRRKAHWNNAEIGFHIKFHRDPNVYDPDLHMMLSFFHV